MGGLGGHGASTRLGEELPACNAPLTFPDGVNLSRLTGMKGGMNFGFLLMKEPLFQWAIDVTLHYDYLLKWHSTTHATYLSIV